MLVHLKIKLASLVGESHLIRNKERHYLGNARKLSGIYNKKHRENEPQLEMPESVALAIQVEDAKEKAQRDYEIFWGLQHHRKNVVRKESRLTGLAIGFLSGKHYDEIEFFAHEEPKWEKIERMACMYGEDDPRDVKQRFEQWVQEAKDYIASYHLAAEPTNI